MKWFVFIFCFLTCSFNCLSQVVNTKGSKSDNLTCIFPIQELPSYRGGDKAWSKFLNKNLKWPSQEEDVMGKVIISFDVEKNGKLDNFKIEKKLAPKFDAEALRVIKLSKKWIPGKQNGKPVKVRYTIPIKFNITE